VLVWVNLPVGFFTGFPQVPSAYPDLCNSLQRRERGKGEGGERRRMVKGELRRVREG